MAAEPDHPVRTVSRPQRRRARRPPLPLAEEVAVDLTHVTYQGPDIDDAAILERLPAALRRLLGSVNGFIQFGGGLHVRGACRQPDRHALRVAWDGDTALHTLYAHVTPQDVPFAQDCVGDQFLLRDGEVLRLDGETGDIRPQAGGLVSFLAAANADPVDYLMMQPLLQLLDEGGTLDPGQLICAYPPFCTVESGKGVSLRAMCALDLIRSHAHVAAQLPPDGSRIAFVVT